MPRRNSACLVWNCLDVGLNTMLNEMLSPHPQKLMDLFEKLIRKPNLYSAWKSLKKNPDSQGIDGVKIKAFQDDLHGNVLKIRSELKAGKYTFKLLKGQLIPKDDGKSRSLKIQAVRDRLVQRAIRNVTDRYFKKYNFPCSYGYIERRSREDAIARIISLRNRKFKYVLEADIESFFETVNQTILKEKIFKVLPDSSIDHLIEAGLDTEIGNKEYFSEDKIVQYFSDGTVGISQGGILSPLYANLYLCEFDKFMLDNKFQLVRYADDFVVLCKSRSEAQDAHDKAKEFLDEKLKLKLHPLGDKKTKIVHFSQGFNFLGFTFNRSSICPNVKVRKKFRERIVQITNPRDCVNLVNGASELKNTVKGWGNVYSFCHSENIRVNPKDKTMIKIFESLDQLIGSRFFRLLEKSELRSAGKRWGEFHLKKFGIPFLKEFLLKRTLREIQAKRIKKRKSKVGGKS